MTMNAKRRRAHDKLAALPGVRPVRRPVTPRSDVAGQAAPAATTSSTCIYVRTGRKSAHPLVIIPGGPGAASVALYRGFRRRAAAEGLDVIMVEHRGVGMSRHDDSGCDLPPAALTIDQVVDDVAAVLDDAQVDKAVIYGTSYGTYVAAGVGVRHPDRVHAMVLDSPVLSAQDIDDVRDATRRLLWDGDDPETAALAPKVRQLVDGEVLTPAAAQLAATVYGFAGPAVLKRQLDLLLAGRPWLWSGAAAGPPGFCSNARRRTVTSPTWSAGSGIANSITGPPPTASRSTLPSRFVSSPPVQRSSTPSPTTLSRRCRSSPGRQSSSPAAAI